jgi:hypothetical protein
VFGNSCYYEGIDDVVVAVVRRMQGCWKVGSGWCLQCLNQRGVLVSVAPGGDFAL